MGTYYAPTGLNIARPQGIDLRNFNTSLAGLTGSISDIQNKRLAEAEILRKQANADRTFGLQEANAKRLQSEYDRGVAGDAALRTYTQQLGNYGSDVVPEADAMVIQKAYEANPNVDVQNMVDAAQNRYNADTAGGAQSRIDMLSNVAMPEGQYDPTKLIAMQERAVAKPKSTLDTIVAARAKEQVRQQGLQDQMNMAIFKEGIKTVKPAAKEAEYKMLLKDGMAPAEARLLVWGDKSGKGGSSSSKSSKTFSMDPKAIKELDLDFFGAGDTQKAISIGQKLQDSFGLRTPEVTALLQQSIGGLIDKSLETDKLAEALRSSGLVKNSYYTDGKTGDTKVMTGTMMAEALQNPDIVIRTNSDGSRVFVDEGKEREKLRKLNTFNRSLVPKTTVNNVDTKSTTPLGYYPELMP